MTVRELKNLLERLEKMNLDYADAKVLFRTSNDMDEEFEFGMLDHFLNDAKMKAMTLRALLFSVENNNVFLS